MPQIFQFAPPFVCKMYAKEKRATRGKPHNSLKIKVISMGFEPMTLPMKIGMPFRLRFVLRQKKPRRMPRLQCDLDGIRTHDSLIKSQVLYRLSYEIIVPKKGLFSKTAAKIHPWVAKKQTSLKIFTNDYLASPSYTVPFPKIIRLI